MKLRRVLATMLAAALVVPVLAGCGGGGKEASSEGGGSDSGVLDVKIWDATQQEGIQTICDEWSETSGIEAKVEVRSEEHTSELQSRFDLVCRLLLEKKKKKNNIKIKLKITLYK